MFGVNPRQYITIDKYNNNSSSLYQMRISISLLDTQYTNKTSVLYSVTILNQISTIHTVFDSVYMTIPPIWFIINEWWAAFSEIRHAYIQNRKLLVTLTTCNSHKPPRKSIIRFILRIAAQNSPFRPSITDKCSAVLPKKPIQNKPKWITDIRSNKYYYYLPQSSLPFFVAFCNFFRKTFVWST